MFLRELPQPLLAFETNAQISQLKRKLTNKSICSLWPLIHFLSLVHVDVAEENRVAKCREIVSSLPELNYTILKYLMMFISKVCLSIYLYIYLSI